MNGHVCDFETGPWKGERRVCSVPAKFRVKLVQQDGREITHHRCSQHTETLTKGFANTLDDPNHYMSFEAVFIAYQTSSV